MKFSYTKNPKCDFFYKESKSNKKKFWRLGEEGVVVARVSDFFFLFSKESKSEKMFSF